MDEDKKYNKEELLGAVELSNKGPYTPDINRLKEPFQSEKALMYAFCNNCGLVYELGYNEVENLFLILKKPIAPDNNTFFLLHSCGFCKGENTTFELKSIE